MQNIILSPKNTTDRAEHLQFTESRAFYKAQSDNMSPTIKQGDGVVIEPYQGGSIADGVYLLEVNSKPVLRRIHAKTDGGYSLINDNPNYTGETITRAALTPLILAKATGIISFNPI